MILIENDKYLEDIHYIASLPVSWDRLKDSSILISGASGLIGSCLIDTLMEKNRTDGLNCRVCAVARNADRLRHRFGNWLDNRCFSYICQDVNEDVISISDDFDNVVHLASNTHPVAYASEPISTIMTNITGTRNLLEFACSHHAKRVLFASSNEIYGENRGDTELFDESYCGYIDCNTLRAGYPESKRCGEALCQAYIRERGLDIVIARFTRSYGPTVLDSDTKAISQFIGRAVMGGDIILKSEGNQYYSYTYAADAVAGLLTVLLEGEKGEAYNIADERSDIRLKELAVLIADHVGTSVKYELPDEVERSGYSTATRARLDGSKIKQLGWTARYDIKQGINRTLDILQSISHK